MSECVCVCVCMCACVHMCVFLKQVHNANEKLNGGKMFHQSCKILLPKYTTTTCKYSVWQSYDQADNL